MRLANQDALTKHLLAQTFDTPTTQNHSLSVIDKNKEKEEKRQQQNNNNNNQTKKGGKKRKKKV